MNYSSLYCHPLNVSRRTPGSTSVAPKRPVLLCAPSKTPCESQHKKLVLQLSQRLMTAAVAHPELAPALFEALNHGLEQLLLFERNQDWIALEEWLLDG